ncbi:hypothetical protein [Bacillus cereus]|uniref:hypothetical protein n=1 Tax=Bacillus cereus TaxID=1396 RepID=UPI003F52D65B
MRLQLDDVAAHMIHLIFSTFIIHDEIDDGFIKIISLSSDIDPFCQPDSIKKKKI